MTANEVSASYIAGRRDQRDFPNLRDGKAAFSHPASPGEISAPDGNFITDIVRVQVRDFS